ncbi:MAG: PilZ domain-containing protein [Myxococcales bacterium]|nr:PilZ domain-containing protein [Myxococcales bacterium]
MSPANRRRHARVKPQQVTARIRSPGGLHIGLGIENLSVGGAFVRCNTVIPVASRVSLEISRVGAAQPMVVPAKVTTCVSPADALRLGRAAGVGLEFLSVAPHVEAWLTSTVAALLPKPVPPVLEPVRVRRTLPANRPEPSPFGDPEVTQPAIQVASAQSPDAALKQELAALRTKLLKHEALIAELTIENRKLKALLKNQR